MPLGAIDLHGVDAERAIAAHHDHLPFGAQQPGGNAVGCADAEAAEGAGIEIGARRFQPQAGEAQDIAAVGDRDCIRFQHLAQCGEDAVGMHMAVVAGRRARKVLGVFGRAANVLGAQGLRPLNVHRVALRQRGGERGERERRVREQLDFSAPVFAQFFSVIGDAQPACVGQHRRRAVAHLIIELAPQRDHQIGLFHRTRAHCADKRRV